MQVEAADAKSIVGMIEKKHFALKLKLPHDFVRTELDPPMIQAGIGIEAPQVAFLIEHNQGAFVKGNDLFEVVIEMEFEFKMVSREVFKPRRLVFGEHRFGIRKRLLPARERELLDRGQSRLIGVQAAKEKGRGPTGDAEDDAADGD